MLDVILFRSDGTAGFENERVQTFLGELLGSPASRDSRTDDHRVITWCWHFFSEKSGIPDAWADGCAAMLSARNNLKFKFLGKTNFGCVVSVNRDALEDFPEITF